MAKELEKHFWHIGERVPVSGQWRIVGSKRFGGDQRTCSRGEKFPPIRGGGRYVLADRTRQRSKKRRAA